MDLSTLNDHLSRGQRLFIAFSGGPDSACLLHQLHGAVDKKHHPHITCLHVDHGLDPDSSLRAHQAQRIASSLGIACFTHKLDVAPNANREAWAREQRYAFFKTQMRANDLLLTAHHADDVAETMVLRWLRGAGLSGLSGIHSQQPFGPGFLLRPLLDWSKQQIENYLKDYSFSSIQDPSNASMDLDRNVVRHRVIPVIKAHFTGAVEALNRSARLNREASELLACYLKKEVKALQRGHQRLDVGQWHSIGPFQKSELIRLWCLGQHIPPPPGKPLESFVQQLESSRPDALPTLSWGTHKIYLYRSHLWLVQAQASPESSNYRLSWNPTAPIELPNQLGRLMFQPGTPVKLLTDVKQRGLIIQSGQPGDALLLKNDSSPTGVSKLMSQAHIPPWERGLWPRVWLEGDLLACGSRWQHPCLENALVWETECFGAALNPVN